MSVKIVESLFSKMPKDFGISSANQAYVTGQLLMEDKTNGVVIPATSSVSTLNCLGIGTKTYTEGGSNAVIQYIPIATVAVRCVVDCTANTAANQIHKDHLMTSATAVNNTSTTNTSLNGVFHALGQVGAATNNKLYGYFIRSGQVTV